MADGFTLLLPAAISLAFDDNQEDNTCLGVAGLTKARFTTGEGSHSNTVMAVVRRKDCKAGILIGNKMKTFVLLLAILTTQLVGQDKQTQKTEPPRITVQPESAQTSQTEAPPATQQPKTFIEPAAKPTQPPLPQQLITFTADQLVEHDNKILDRAETFYDNRMTHLLWTMGVILAAGLAIVGILIPMILEWQRRRNFTKELTANLSKSEDILKKYSEEQTEELRSELTQQISSPLSLAFLGLGGLFISEVSTSGYALTLQSNVLAMKFYIIGQCSGNSLTAQEIIQLLTYQDKGSQIDLNTLKSVDKEIENMKENVGKIINDEKRADMESQVKELQIFVHSLIRRKEQNKDTPRPQAG